MGIRSVVVRVVVGLGLLSTPAWAGPEEDAAARFQEGQRHYDLAKYEAAIESFKAGYEIVAEPLFLFNIGQAYRQLGDCENARRFYKSFLRNVPVADAVDEQLKAREFIEHMDGCKTPVVAPPVVTPPVGPTVTREPVDVTPVDPKPRSKTIRWIGLGAGGAGVVVLGGSAYFALSAASTASELETDCRSGCDAAEIEARDAAGRSDATRARIFGAIGGAALVTGSAIVIWDVLRGQPNDKNVAVVPLPDGGVFATRAWAF